MSEPPINRPAAPNHQSAHRPPPGAEDLARRVAAIEEWAKTMGFVPEREREHQ
jgi:hypothetical protein